MDLARPSGVVIDSTLDFEALEEAVRARFTADHVFLKGVAEGDGVDVLYTTEPTRVPERYRKPLAGTALHTEVDRLTVTDAKRRGPAFLHRLNKEPADRTQVEVVFAIPEYRSGKPTGMELFAKLNFKYRNDRGRPTVELDYDRIVARAAVKRLPGKEELRIEFAYPIEEDGD